jgi:hypothetical protein
MTANTIVDGHAKSSFSNRCKRRRGGNGEHLITGRDHHHHRLPTNSLHGPHVLIEMVPFLGSVCCKSVLNFSHVFFETDEASVGLAHTAFWRTEAAAAR